jgi:hypothetical protein
MNPIASGRRHATTLAAWALMLTSVGVHGAGLVPYQARYGSTFKGISVGELELTLSRQGAPDTWTYETRAFPSFLASIVVNPKSLEHSVFQTTPAGIDPLEYSTTDGSSAPDNQITLHYDWARGRVTGHSKGAPIDLPLEHGTTDPLSIRAAAIVDLNMGSIPREYAMIDGQDIKHYVYQSQGTERIKTAIGDLDTVIYTSEGKGAQGRGRTWKFWYAPSLHHLLVRAEQHEDGSTRLTFMIRWVHWPDTDAATKP